MISFPETRTIKNQIRAAIGRYVIFYTDVRTDCPICVVDPVTGESLDSFCPYCSGIGYTVVPSGTSILAHITNAPGDKPQFTQGGNWFDGDCRVQIEYTDANLSVVDAADRVIVDNKEYEIKHKHLRGVQELDRILVDLKQSL